MQRGAVAEMESALRRMLGGDAHAGDVLDRDIRAHATRLVPFAELLHAQLRLVRRRPARLLEIGFGHGYVAAAVRRAVPLPVEIFAIEHPGRLEQDPSIAVRAAQAGASLVAADVATDLEGVFDGVEFDAVVLSEVIEHLVPTSVVGVLAAAADRLAAGGALVVSSPNLSAFHRRVSFALGRGRLFDPPLPLSMLGGTFGHIRLYTREEVHVLADAAGLAVSGWHWVEWEGPFLDVAGRKGRLLRAAQEAAARVAPPLSSGWTVVLTPKAAA